MATALAHVTRQMTEDLAAAGVRVKHPGDLTTLEDLPEAAVPVLIRWIEEIGTADLPDRDRWYLWDTVARALSVRAARPDAGPALVRLFRDPRLPEGYKWTVGNALDQVADAALLDEMIELATDRSHRGARQMVVQALGRIGKGPRREEVIDVLIGELDDDDVVAFAITALMKLKATRAVEQISRHVDSPVPIAKKAARIAVAKLGGSGA
ncbi:MAG: hypothetical protein HOV71_19865 [Hamadaea sp.]|nr:hypothetical protein [Hamadaea sp.]NUR50388.1 hypothetical protein [Hamadaea sp.]NUR96286.1 hypothetical protein [Kribbellaceae bacterium]NUT03156.1 hypothetical protein [Hamadaea sp.]